MIKDIIQVAGHDEIASQSTWQANKADQIAGYDV
jgi:hypothetical protein